MGLISGGDRVELLSLAVLRGCVGDFDALEEVLVQVLVAVSWILLILVVVVVVLACFTSLGGRTSL